MKSRNRAITDPGGGGRSQLGGGVSDHPAFQPGSQARIRQQGHGGDAQKENGSWPTSSSTLVLWTLSCWGKPPTGAATQFPDPPEGTVRRQRTPPGLKPECGERGVPISRTLLGVCTGSGRHRSLASGFPQIPPACAGRGISTPKGRPNRLEPGRAPSGSQKSPVPAREPTAPRLKSAPERRRTPD